MTFDEWWESAKPASAVMDSAWEWEFRKYIAKAAWEAAQPQWRPIATAPKNGDSIISWSAVRGTTIAHWHRERARAEFPGAEYWLDEATDEGTTPERWMPLPPAPEKTK